METVIGDLETLLVSVTQDRPKPTCVSSTLDSCILKTRGASLCDTPKSVNIAYGGLISTASVRFGIVVGNKSGATDQNRTGDLRITNASLYRLSYGGIN